MTIIDVRTPEEYEESHVDGAINFPLDRMIVGEMPLIDRDEEVTIYCRSGVRANKAIELMRQHGFTNISGASGLEDVEG